MVAARDGHLDIVRLLVELGADSDAAVKLALQLGHVEVAGLMAELGVKPRKVRRTRLDTEDWEEGSLAPKMGGSDACNVYVYIYTHTYVYTSFIFC